MTRPAARVLALLEILQNGGTHSAASLAGRLGVDERTVRRYAGHLADLEVPVEAVRGRHGGYRLAPGFRMPPLMLTDEEALAVLLGLAAARRAGAMGPSGEAGESAAAKVRRVLPRALAARLDTLFATVDLTAADGADPGPAASVMLRLAEATTARRPVLIAYRDRADRRSRRTLFPYGIVAHSGHWYVTGRDSASGDLRTFRLDRIEHVAFGDGTFAVPGGFEAAGAVRASLAATPWRYRVVVAVRGEAAEVRERLPSGLAVVEPDAEFGAGWVVARLRAERLDWLPALLAGLGRPFLVREPAELRDVVRAWAERVAAGAAAGSAEEAAAAWR